MSDREFASSLAGPALVAALALLLPAASAAHEGDSDHARDDAYWAEQARLLDEAPFVAPPVVEPLASQAGTLGQWGPVLAWPHIPVSAANLPDGRILTFASNRRNAFPAGSEFTYAAVWNPATQALVEINHVAHDMFCGHLVMLEDGRVFINGGRNTVPLTSAFDFQANQWSLLDDMNRGRWYPTSLALSDGQVFTALGSGGGTTGEIWHPSSGWRDLPGMNLSSLMNGVGFERDWWPFLSLDPTGRIFHFGPVADMHRLDPSGSGSLVNLGPWMASNRWYPKDAAVVMYDEGRILVAGGTADGAVDGAATARSLAIDVNGLDPIATEIAPMAFPRRYANAVALPDLRVLVVGGNTSGAKFSDSGTVLTPEIWNPETGAWAPAANMAVPRNYHSVALLMADGRVFVGGGGLCDCSGDHQDAQIFSPPYLFNADGTPAPRPAISTAPAQIRNGQDFEVEASPGVASFTLIKMSATTHAMNTDLRMLEPPMLDLGGGHYRLGAHGNRDVLTPGYWMLFALNASGAPSVARIVQVTSAGAPQVTHPGDQLAREGDAVSLAIAASDPDGDPLSFAASGLPFGLSIDPATGVVSGTVSEWSAGLYDVSVDVSDPVGPTTILFAWTVFPQGLGSGQILREWWTGLSGTAIAALTGAAAYPDSPTGSNFLASFEAPTNWADSYGTRVRGYVHPPLGGSYRFWIASDDAGELWLSTDEFAANASRIAWVPGWTSSRQWDKYPEQASAPIPLQAGERYYVEALQKEGGGGDNLAVAWEIPGVGFEVIQGLYLSPLEFAPSLEGLPDRVSLEGDPVSVQVEASDPNADPLHYSAQNLPPGLAIGAASGAISGQIAALAMGSYAVEIGVDDGTGESASTGFDWEVYPSGAELAGDLGAGVACHDGASGSGYLMYSAESVFERFAAAPPPAGSAAHFVCVVLLAGHWHYDADGSYHPFTPVATDVLVAQLDFELDLVLDLAGSSGEAAGIARGYASGDLAIAPDLYGGAFDDGEFAVAGSYLVPHAQPVPIPALPAWGRALLVAALAAAGLWRLGRRRP